MRARMLAGYWIMRVPKGYKMEKRSDGKVMVRDFADTKKPTAFLAFAESWMEKK